MFEGQLLAERRVDPQIVVGLLVDRAGFPLEIGCYEGNKAETKTMLPVLHAFMAAHQLTDVTVVADAGMFSEANQAAIEADLRAFVETHLDLPDDVLGSRCEQVVRNHDPCISCATHFLKLDVDRV